MTSSPHATCTYQRPRDGNRLLALVPSGLILAVVAVTFFSASADQDFFWHRATVHEAMILRGYWLAQVVYQCCYAQGLYGIALLKSAAIVNLLDHSPETFMSEFQGNPYQQKAALWYFKKTKHWSHFAILALTDCISLRHARYMPFCVLGGGLCLPPILDRYSLARLRGRAMVGTCAGLMGVAFVSTLGDGRTLRAGLDPFRFPERAAAFIAAAGASNNLFSTGVWGGDLLWRLPKVTVLNDTRALSDASNLKTNRITQRTGNLEKNLQALDARNIVPSECDPMSSFLGNLWGRLLTIDDWRLVCADNIALVYFRSDVDSIARPLTRQGKIETSLKHALGQTQRAVAMYPHALRHWGEPGQVHAMRREKPAAMATFLQVLTSDHGNSNYQTMLSMMEVS